MPDDLVTLSFPASTDRVRLARVVVATLADEAGLDYDAVEDLRIAVDELCFLLLEAGTPNGSLTLTATRASGHLQVEGSCRFDDQPTEPGDDPSFTLTRQILGTVVDDYDLAFDGSSGRFSLRKTTP
ncbi:MAG: ATP-binding protein [Acidimicrobiales bacterium]